MKCQHCRIGHYQSIQVPYIQWHNGRILVMPHAPASSCDVCGYMEYDAAFIYKLDYLLDKLSEQSPNLAPKQAHPIFIKSAQWSPTRRS